MARLLVYYSVAADDGQEFFGSASHNAISDREYF